MYFLVFILLFMSLFVLMLFNKPAIIFFEFDTNQDDLYLLFYWLYPLLKFRVQIINYTPFLFIYLFRIRIYSKAIKAKTEKKQITVEDYHALVLNSTYAKLYYGLSNPLVVSVTVGYGGGNASMKGQSGSGSSSTTGAGSSNTGTGALGLGAKLCTDAIIMIDNQNVSMLSVNSSAGNITDKIPQIISGMSQNKQSGQSQQSKTQA
jgi:uncharacterized spore protein YtfJ